MNFQIFYILGTGAGRRAGGRADRRGRPIVSSGLCDFFQICTSAVAAVTIAIAVLQSGIWIQVHIRLPISNTGVTIKDKNAITTRMAITIFPEAGARRRVRSRCLW